jgi:hypothetical protein
MYIPVGRALINLAGLGECDLPSVGFIPLQVVDLLVHSMTTSIDSDMCDKTEAGSQSML